MDHWPVLALVLRRHLWQLSELEVRQVHRLLRRVQLRRQDRERLLSKPQVLPVQDPKLYVHPLHEDLRRIAVTALDHIQRLLLHDRDGVRVVSGDGSVEVVRARAEAVAVHPSRTRFAYSDREDLGMALYVSAGDEIGDLVGRTTGDVEGLTWGPGPDQLTFVERGIRDHQALTVLDTHSGDTSVLELLSEPHQAAEPSWSRDGRWLAFEAQTTVALGPMTVYVRGGGDGQLTTVDPLEGLTTQSAAPRFHPTMGRLAYVYTKAGALVSELRFFDVDSAARQSVDQRGLNAFRWSDDGNQLLVARHVSVCNSELVRVSADTLEVASLYTGDGNVAPMYLDDELAMFVSRRCDGSDYVPTGTGTLLALEVATGQTVDIAHEVFSGVPLNA